MQSRQEPPPFREDVVGNGTLNIPHGVEGSQSRVEASEEDQPVITALDVVKEASLRSCCAKVIGDQPARKAMMPFANQ